MVYQSTDVRENNNSYSRWALLRWLASSATMSIPQAAGPVAFSLVALSLTGETSGGAAILLAMTLAQVIGAVPLTRLGKDLPPATYLRLLITCRTLAFAAIALCAHYETPFIWLIPLAAIAGSVNAAAYGYLRSLLSQLTPSSHLPRALGMASTLNELMFVLAPVMASAVGHFSPVLGIVAFTILGAAPALLIPNTRPVAVEEVVLKGGPMITPIIAMWLTCQMAGCAAIAAVEIGSVAMALQFGYDPSLAILFTIPLCLASVAGGVWVSVRNRMASQKAVQAQLAVMAVGSVLVAVQFSVATTVLGTLLIGFMLAPLGTYYTLILENLAPPHRRVEIFALQRTAIAIGIIVASAVITVASLSTALVFVAGLMCAVAIGINIVLTMRHECRGKK